MTCTNSEAEKIADKVHKDRYGRELDFEYVVPTGLNAGKTTKETFIEKVSVSPEDCWFWLGQLFKNGYGRFYTRGVQHLAHRVSFELYHGRQPSGVLMHACDIPMCVNPAHLIEGSIADNVRDKIGKGRGRGPRSEESSRCKLSDEQVSEIVVRREQGERCYDLAAEYGVSESWISVISRGLQRSYVMESKDMTPSKYVELAMRTKQDFGYKDNLVHAAMLLSSESGEVCSEVKRLFAYGKPVDMFNMKAELGDILWGVALMCDTLNIAMEDVMQTNINKLKARFPDGYSDEAAITRNKSREEAAIRGVL